MSERRPTADPSGKGLPVNLDSERYVLGSILLTGSLYVDAAGVLKEKDFSLESHRRIWRRMGEVNARGEEINRVTVANELMKFGEFESVGGLTYLVSLDEGMPLGGSIDSYLRVVKEKSLRRSIIFATQRAIDRCFMQEDRAEEIMADLYDETFNFDSEKHSDGPRTSGTVIEALPEGITYILDPSRRARGISTGFTKYDDWTAGMHDGDLIILAGRPGSGKTALALNIVEHVAVVRKIPAVFFSLEMSNEQLLSRLLCSRARVDSQKYRAGYLDDKERGKLNRALNEIMEAPLWIDDNPGVRLNAIHAKLRRLKAKHGVRIAFIDYLQLMGGFGENRVQEISSISRGLKLIAKELQMPLVVLSQLSRAVEQRKDDHRPQLSDLRDSGSIEQDCDTCAFVFREEMYKPKEQDLKNKAELIIRKQRQGPIGTVKLVFIHSQTRFENRAEDTGDLLE